MTLNEIRCRGTLQSRWSKLTDSTSRKAEENVNVTDESRTSWYSSWNGTGGSSDDGGRWRQMMYSLKSFEGCQVKEVFRQHFFIYERIKMLWLVQVRNFSPLFQRSFV